MKLALLKWTIQPYYPRGGLLALAVFLLLASASLAQLADTQIAFMSNRSGNGEIHLMNPDGKRVRRLTKHPQYDAFPAWSPDGRKITFMSFRNKDQLGETRGEIYAMNADGKNLINLTQSPERHERASAWSPDSKQIVFQSGGNLWVMDANGGNSHSLTNDDATRDMYPDWSPDGQQIVFTSDRNRVWEVEARDNWDIYVMNADGTNLINLTNHPARDRSPAWSPDGMRIAFTSNRDGNWEVYVMNADGTNPINLTNHPAGDGLVSWGSVRPLGVAPKGKLATLWGQVKRSNAYDGK